MIEELLTAKARRRAATPSTDSQPPDTAASVRAELESIRDAFPDHEAYRNWKQREADLENTRRKLAEAEAAAKAAADAVPAALEAGTDPSEAELTARTKQIEAEQLARRIPVLESLVAKARDHAAETLRELVRGRLRAACDKAREESCAIQNKIEAFQRQHADELSRCAGLLRLGGRAPFWARFRLAAAAALGRRASAGGIRDSALTSGSAGPVAPPDGSPARGGPAFLRTTHDEPTATHRRADATAG